MSLPTCVVLDLDDTLFLERTYALSGFRRVGEHVDRVHGRAGFAEVATSLLEEGHRGTIFDEALRTVGLEPTPETVRSLVWVYRTHRPSIALLPDAARLIEALAGRYVGVLTDGPLESQVRKAAAIGAPRWADHVVYTASLGAGFSKPHPLGFALHERHAHVTGTACAYIADNPAKDFRGARRLGWRTVRVRRPRSLHVALESGDDVDVEVETHEALRA